MEMIAYYATSDRKKPGLNDPEGTVQVCVLSWVRKKIEIIKESHILLSQETT